MKPMIFCTAAASALILTGAVSAQPGPRAPHAGPDGEHRRGAMALMMLGAADYDGNNTVTRAEVERLQGEEFAFRDRNGDGYLDQADASPTRQRLAAIRPEAGEDAPRRPGRRSSARLDADGDGRISRAEFLGRELRVFDRLDADGDDAVSPDEIDSAMESRRERRGARRDAMQWWRD